MAENKYEMLVRPRRLDSNFKIQPQPWYRERLNTKYEKKPTLLGSSWTFIREGIDDFRNGSLKKLDTSIILKGNKGIKPSIFGSGFSVESNANQGRISGKPLSKEEAAFSKALPSQHRKQKKVDQVEKELLCHPLALYPHIEDSVPPDLFEEIVDLLDPSMTLANDIYDGNSTSNGTVMSETTQNIDLKTEINNEEIKDQITIVGSQDDICNSKGVDSAFRRFPKVEEHRTDERNSKRKGKQTQLAKIENVTKDFCGWIRDLGGESNNIEENTINNLFATGYESKPTLSVPVHVVELTSVPAELRTDVDDNSNVTAVKTVVKKQSNYTPSWVKVKYGAWYLDPKTWRVHESNKPLIDPREIEEKQMSESKKKSKNLDKTLTGLHGAKAFKEFIVNRGTRQPEFLDSVAALSKENTEINVANGNNNNNNQPK